MTTAFVSFKAEKGLKGTSILSTRLWASLSARYAPNSYPQSRTSRSTCTSIQARDHTYAILVAYPSARGANCALINEFIALLSPRGYKRSLCHN